MEDLAGTRYGGDPGGQLSVAKGQPRFNPSRQATGLPTASYTSRGHA